MSPGIYPVPQSSGIWRAKAWCTKKSTLKPPLNTTNRAKRLDFATEWLANGLESTGVVIWSDETTVKSRPNSHRVSSYVHATAPAPVQDRIQGGGISVMFWRRLSSQGRGPLVVVNETMNSQKYLETLRDYFLPEPTHLIRSGTRVSLMHDNSPCHTSRAVKAYLADAGLEFLDWPPFSPDLNPIENIWGWIKFQLYSGVETSQHSFGRQF
jgi:hypothetical protein